jgi:hypothetical protein
MRQILIDRLENQIEKMFDTLLEIEKEEQIEPMRELSNRSKTALSMIFSSQLTKSMWNMLKDK